MTEDEDDLGIDLDAWQVPPAPSGIADGVIARMREQNTQVTVTPVEPERTKAPWIVGAVAAVAGIAALATFGLRHSPGSGHGVVTAEQPMRLALGDSSAELERGARVEWLRDRYTLVARQTGTTTWHVNDDDKLRIDAALASIEATDANLRVEVQMDSTKKTMATSAATAAAVALVTVIVYNGTVKVTSAEDSKTLPAGSAITIKAKGENVVSQEMSVGASPDTQKLMAEIDRLQKERAELLAQVEALQAPGKEPPGVCDEVACVLNNYEGACCLKYKRHPNVPDALDRANIAAAITPLKPKIADCGVNSDGTVKAHVKVNPDGTVADVSIKTTSDAAPSMGTEARAKCIEDVLRGAQFKPTLNGGMFTYPFVFTAPVKACNGDADFQAGMDAFSAASYAVALDKFESALTCKQDANTRKFAFAAACKSKNLSKAQFYWKQLSSGVQDEVSGFCVAQGILREDLENGGSPSGSGKLRLASKPFAKIFIDGKEIGTTPIDTTVTAGKHRVTYQIGDSKHTFAVTVKAGETVRMIKDFSE